MMERREFLRACAVMLGSSVFPIACSQSGNEATTSTDSSPSSLSYSKQQFLELPATVFSVTHESYGVIDMQLVEVEDEAISPGTEQFSVCLDGPDNPVFEEGSYAMYNDSLGDIELFLQPAEGSASGQKYRAIFSLLDA